MATLAELLKTNDPDLSKKAGDEYHKVVRKEQSVSIRESRDGRKGKTVTIISGFTHGDHRLSALASAMKKQCGVGGTVDGNTIVLQGSVKKQASELMVRAGWDIRNG